MSSSSPPSPSDLLKNLSLRSKTGSTQTMADLSVRAIEIRDVLSSFDRNVLPAELRPQTFLQLDRSSHERPPVSQWTIQEDLESTLLQWGTYSDEGYDLLRQLQSDSILARLYHEKLARRFRELLEQYDRLTYEYEDGSDEPAVRAAAQAQVQHISRKIRDVVAAVREDLPHREVGQEAIATRLLEAMIDICRRNTDVIPSVEPRSVSRQTTHRLRTTPSDHALSLYEALIQSPPDDQSQGLFMLDALETFPVAIFANLQAQHHTLMQLLETNNAPQEYQYRMGRVVSETSLESAGNTPRPLQGADLEVLTTSPTEVSSPTLASSQGQIQSRVERAGPVRTTSTSSSVSKRSADDVGNGTKRGKKKATR